MEISVVVPVLNEAGNIAPLLTELETALGQRYDYEVIYVDDGSDDSTAAELAEARTRYTRLRVVTHATPCGQSAALRSGIKAARGRWIATLDGDGQNDPRDIPALFDLARQSSSDNRPVLVAGYRKQRRDSIVKRLSSRIANAVRSRLLGDATPDTGCGLKVFGRTEFLDLPYFDHMHRFLPALFLRTGAAVLSAEVNHRHRSRGKSKYGTLDRLVVGITDLLGVMWLIRRSHIPRVTESRNALD